MLERAGSRCKGSKNYKERNNKSRREKTERLEHRYKIVCKHFMPLQNLGPNPGL